jgi:hypothetical protein
VSVADPEIDQLYEAIVTVPAPLLEEWRTPSATHRLVPVVMVAIPLTVYVAAFVFYLVDLFTHRFVPTGNYVLLVQMTVQMLCIVVCLYLRQFSRSKSKLPEKASPLAIFKSGIALHGQYKPWKSVGTCRWDCDSLRMLMIEIKYGEAYWQEYALIPHSHRLVVEETFRRFGKWDQPGEADEMPLETGMSLDLSACQTQCLSEKPAGTPTDTSHRGTQRPKLS